MPACGLAASMQICAPASVEHARDLLRQERAAVPTDAPFCGESSGNLAE
jgi:hypothetical protein